jgi:hypothetical protein
MTITRANVRATTNANDFILVRQINNALETFPITITKNRVHLLSTFYRPGHGPEIRPPGVTAGLLIAADNVEVAGFEINAGNNTVDCITFSTVAATWGADIHHNRFGFQVPARDGINMSGAVDKPHFTIHDNLFGTGIAGNGLARTGIYIEQNSTRSTIYRNTFRMGAGLRGINLATLCTAIYSITDNYFCTDGATQGSAILCNINSTDCMFVGNHAMWLAANPAQNPYLDLGLNHWGMNYAGDVVIYPV